jgi:hypothetical protein
MKVEQVRYVRWGKEKPEHAGYWNAVDSMADLIGMALRSGGINVVQTKEKYGRACVYVGACDDEDAPLTSKEHRQHYQRVYQSALLACPWLRGSILDGADYPKLALGEEEP